MNDDEERFQGPMPSPEWLRAQRERLIAEDDKREEQSAQSLIAEYGEMARRQVEAFAKLPCQGSLDRISECGDAFALTCERRTSPSCPREIRRFDERRRRQEVRDRLADADLSPEEIAAILERDLAPDDASALLRMLAHGVQLDPALSVVCGFRMTTATQAVDRFLSDERKRTLVLAGDVGVGKSVAAGYVLRRRAGLFLSSSELSEAARFGDENDARRQRLFKVPLLVLDDVGLEKDWVIPLVEQILAERHNDRLRTVITCNMPAPAFRERYGPRVADRIGTAGMFIVLLGESLRVAR